MQRTKLFAAALLAAAMTASSAPAIAAEDITATTADTLASVDDPLLTEPVTQSTTSPAVAESMQALDDALLAVGAPPAAANDDVALPSDGKRKAGLDTDSGRLVMNLPVTDQIGDDGLTRIFDGHAADTEVAVSPTADGMRAIISLQTPDAPQRHQFGIGGDVRALVEDDDGRVHAFSEDGSYVATAEKPWAIDAQGREVPTWYETNGTTLVQVIDHRDHGYAYPITADPNWWQVAKCVFAISVVVASTYFAVTKVTKLRKLIGQLGGLRETAKLLLKATSRREKVDAVFKGMAALAAWFFGIDNVRESCGGRG